MSETGPDFCFQRGSGGLDGRKVPPGIGGYFGMHGRRCGGSNGGGFWAVRVALEIERRPQGQTGNPRWLCRPRATRQHIVSAAVWLRGQGNLTHPGFEQQVAALRQILF